jgi:F0F1-type ATP synthase epsilon subunit
VLTELVESAHEIDADRAQQAETRARETLSSLSVSGDNWEAEQQRLSKYEAKFKRALVRQQVSQFG